MCVLAHQVLSLVLGHIRRMQAVVAPHWAVCLSVYRTLRRGRGVWYDRYQQQSPLNTRAKLTSSVQGSPQRSNTDQKNANAGEKKIHIFPHSCVLTLQKQTSCWRSVCKRQDRQHDVFLTPHIGTFLKWQARWLTEWLCKLTQGNCQRWNTVMSLQANLHWTGER